MLTAFLAEFQTAIIAVIVGLLGTAITAVAGVIGTKVKDIYEKKVNTQVEKELADQVVLAVEQTYKTLHGEEKLNKAIEDLTTRLQLKGITVTDVECRSLIEAAVAGFNNAFNSATEKAEENESLTKEEKEVTKAIDAPIEWHEEETSSETENTEEENLLTEVEEEDIALEEVD